MAFNFGQWLPYLISGGATVVGSLIGSRASGRAAETQAQAAEQNSETQLQLSRDQIKNIRDVYNLDLSLNWPRHRLASESLGRLALGSGSKLPMSAFDTTEAPPELPGFGAPGEPGTEGEPPTTDLLDPAAGGHFPTPPNRGPGARGRTASGIGTGAGLGATIGSVVPGIGTAIGAGVGAAAGAVGSLFGRGRREADTIVPYQNELVRRTGLVGTELSRRIKDGSITEQDWDDAGGIVRSMRDQFYQFSDQYGRAGPGARSTIDSWFNPMLDAWDNQDSNWADDWRSGTYFPNRANLPPSRQFGGPVSRSFSAMSKPTNQQQYLVGEVGPEMYMPQRGAPMLIGRDGPEVFNPPQDGYIVPNNQLPGQQGQKGQTHTLADLGKNTWGLLSRQEGGSVIGPRPGYRWSTTYGWMSEEEAGRIEREESEYVGKRQGFWASPEEYYKGTTPSADTPPPPMPTEDPGSTGPEPEPGSDIRLGEFLDPWTGSFNYGPAPDPFSYAPGKNGYQPFNERFKYAPGEHGYQPLNEQFNYAPGEHGYQPLNEQFNYAPGEHGYQPLNEQFKFNSDDLMKDPGYKFRLEEGNKAIERNAASRGFLQSGRTGKSLGQYSQGLASQEYGKAYGRALGEFGISQGQSRDAYGRALGEFGISQGQSRDAYGRALGEFGISQGQSRDAYGRALGEFGISQGQSRDAYNRELGEWGSRYGMYGDAYNRRWQEYLNDRDEWTNARNWKFNTLSQLSGI